jgi:phospholipase/lecithinase/hemolysin
MPSSQSRFALAVLIFSVFLSTAQANPISTIYAFGDSLSDAGNVKAVLGYPSAPYVNGHFTNGQVWVQDLAASLGLAPLSASLAGGNDFAVGGAQSGTSPVHTASVGDLPSQLAAFHTAHAAADPNALYTLWIGGDDARAILASNPSSAQAAVDIATSVGNIDLAISTLAGYGAKNVLVVTVPDLSKTPEAISTGPLGVAAASALSASFDNLLVNGSTMAGIPSLAGLATLDSLNLKVLDSYSIIDGIVAQPAPFGFTDVTDPCLVGAVNFAGGSVCANPNQFLFWDYIHPTAVGHSIVAADAFQVLSPEPATVTMISVGILALFAVRKRFRAA